MPSPGRHNAAPSARSSSYKRRSPDRKRRMDPPSRGGGSSARSGSPARQREHRRDIRPSRMGDHRGHSPETANSNGRSFSTASSKRKGSPKIELDIPRIRDVDERGSRLAVPPRKMMRSVSPPVRDIPSVGPSRSSPPPRPYNRPNKVPATNRFASPESSPPPAPRNYPGSTVPASRGYAEAASTSQANPRSYSTSSTKRSYGAMSATFRRSTSEERQFPQTSALKRTTGHLTTSRFGGLRDADDSTLLRDEDVAVKQDVLKGYVFNIDNESSKLARSGHGIIRKIINPETLQVVRRPVPTARETGSAYFDEDDWEGDELYRGRDPPWTRSREGSRPIFDREEIVQQSSGRPSRDDDFHGRGDPPPSPPIVQVARYVPSDHYRDDPRDSRNGQSHSRTVVSREESSHSRAGPSRETREAPSRSREAFYDEGEREYRSSRDGGDHAKASRSSRRDDNDDLRHELELRRDSSNHSGERIRSRARSREARAGSDSDLRVRINEKRTHSPDHGYRRERTDDRSRDRHHSPSGERRRSDADRSRPREERRRSSPSHDRRHEEPEEYYEAPKPWEIDPEFVPRGRAYFEHDNREDGMMVHPRGRGGMRMRPFGYPYRGRGPRLPYRGPPPFHQGGYYLYNRAPMIRGFRPPRMPRRSSPQWEHDMFDKISAEPDVK